MQMQWDKLNLFYEVAKAGSILGGSKALHISQSALSHSIQQLEYRLKTKLFDRSHTGIKLTANGQKLFDHTCNMRNEFAVVTKFIENDNEGQVGGTLKILTTYALASSWLIHYVGEFMEKFPEIIIQIQCDNNLFHPGITETSLGSFLVHRPDLTQTYIKTFYTKLFASKEYLKKFGTPKTVDDLASHHIITSGYPEGPNCAISNWLMQLGSSKNNKVKPYLSIDSAHGILNAARNNLGIIALGKNHPTLERADDIIEILSEVEGPAFDLYYSYPNQMKNIKSVVEFGIYLEQKFSQDSHLTKMKFIENNKYNNILQFSQIA